MSSGLLGGDDEPMGVQLMNCPSCGKQASEFQPGKWRCLTCGAYFEYQAPRQPDRYVKIETVTGLAESSFFVCAICGGKFNRANHPEYTCKECKRSVCSEHMGKGERPAPGKESMGRCAECVARDWKKHYRFMVIVAGIVAVAGAIIFGLLWALGTFSSP